MILASRRGAVGSLWFAVAMLAVVSGCTPDLAALTSAPAPCTAGDCERDDGGDELGNADPEADGAQMRDPVDHDVAESEDGDSDANETAVATDATQSESGRQADPADSSAVTEGGRVDASAAPDGNSVDASSDADARSVLRDASTTGDGGCALGLSDGYLCTFGSGASCASFPSASWNIYTEAKSANDGGDLVCMVAFSADEGHSCAGALSFTVPFDAYSVPNRVMTILNFTADWTDKIALHGWMKIVKPTGDSLAYLNGVQFSVSSSSYGAFRGQFAAASIFSDGQWHEMIIPLDPAPSAIGTYLPSNVNQIGVQLIAKNAMPPGGPAAPLTTQLLVDDIWLE